MPPMRGAVNRSIHFCVAYQAFLPLIGGVDQIPVKQSEPRRNRGNPKKSRTTMNRLLIGAAAAACALSLAACNPSDISALQGAAATTSPNLPPSAVVSTVLADAGVSAATTAKVNANITAVQKAALALCRIKPLASGILNIGIALSPSLSTVASSGIAQQVSGAATIACNALASAPTYASTGRGHLVRGTAHVNGLDVPVYGVRY